MKEVPMYSPIPEQLSFRLKLSMYNLKSIGEIIPPCLTPFVTQKLVEHVLPKRTNAFNFGATLLCVVDFSQKIV